MAYPDRGWQGAFRPPANSRTLLFFFNLDCAAVPFRLHSMAAIDPRQQPAPVDRFAREVIGRRREAYGGVWRSHRHELRRAVDPGRANGRGRGVEKGKCLLGRTLRRAHRVDRDEACVSEITNALALATAEVPERIRVRRNCVRPAGLASARAWRLSRRSDGLQVLAQERSTSRNWRLIESWCGCPDPMSIATVGQACSEPLCGQTPARKHQPAAASAGADFHHS